MHYYKKTFILKDLNQRNSVNFSHYTTSIITTVSIYNNICSRTPNFKHISVVIHNKRLDFDIQSQKQLSPKYVGIALRLFSQILVNNYGFLPFCTSSDPRKLFISA